MRAPCKVLIIGKVWPEPKSSAAGTRMMQLIQSFREAEYEIVFASTANASEFQEDLSSLGIETRFIELNSASFDEFLLVTNPSVVVFDRFMTEEQFGWRVMENCPDALRILNSEDLHFLRHAREEALRSNGNLDTLNLYSDMALREVASIFRVDFTLLLSEFEIDLLKNRFQTPEHKLYYYPLFAKVLDINLPSFESRNDFIFIGNFLHTPNWDALGYLKKEIWPLIHKKLPAARMNVHGAYPNQKVTDFHNPKEGFFVHGRVEDAQSVTLKARVSLAPLRFGAGIKGKLIEAMACGTPSVTTSIGAEDMHYNELWSGEVANTPEDFAEAAVRLYTTSENWNNAQQHGFKILSIKYNYENHLVGFKNEIQYRVDNLKELRSNDFISLLLQHHSVLSTKYLSKWIEEKNRKSL